MRHKEPFITFCKVCWKEFSSDKYLYNYIHVPSRYTQKNVLTVTWSAWHCYSLLTIVWIFDQFSKVLNLDFLNSHSTVLGFLHANTRTVRHGTYFSLLLQWVHFMLCCRDEGGKITLTLYVSHVRWVQSHKLQACTVCLRKNCHSVMTCGRRQCVRFFRRAEPITRRRG
jgi:hypothetical protein